MKRISILLLFAFSLFSLTYPGISAGIETGSPTVAKATVAPSVSAAGVTDKTAKAKTTSKSKPKAKAKSKVKPGEKLKPAVNAAPPFVPVAVPSPAVVAPMAAPVVAPVVAPAIVIAPNVGQLFDAVGDVRLALGGQAAQSVVKGAALKNGMTVTTGNKSTAVLKFEDGEAIALGENSTFKIENYRYFPKEIEKSSMAFSILAGSMRAITGLIASKHPANFNLKAPTATIGIRGTVFLYSIVNGTSYMQVVSGSISVMTTNGTMLTLGAGQTIVVSAAGTVTATGAAAASAASSAGAFTSVNTVAATLGAASAGTTGASAAGSVAASTASTGAIGGLSTAAITGIGAGVAVVGAIAGGGGSDSGNNNSGGGTGTTGTTGTTGSR